MKRLLLLSFLIFQIFATVSANSFYVSSAALATGTGSFNAPWQFQIALNHPSALKPGDTVW
jgi:hypothetical protein